MNPPIPNCRVIPLPNHQVSFEIAGTERLRWHFDDKYPRPFLYPLIGPSEQSLTRMGHPGAPDHDHHRSIWFGHEKVAGVNFWSDRTDARVRQTQWLAYEDGDEAVMAVELVWQNGSGQRLLQQQLVAALRPLGADDLLLELQATFRPIGDSIQLGKSNFGFLGLRMAKSLSAHFGSGVITNSEGQVGEPNIFGSYARWVDYSGHSRTTAGAETAEGITYFDHRQNIGYPAHWHVREDGWMGASLCRLHDVTMRSEEPLVLRYLLHAHGGPFDPGQAEQVNESFAQSAAFEVKKSTKKHVQYEAQRK